MGVRASAKYPDDQALVGGAVLRGLARQRLAGEYETVTFTVNNVTAQEQLGAYEPVNVTSEFGVRLGVHF